VSLLEDVNPVDGRADRIHVRENGETEASIAARYQNVGDKRSAKAKTNGCAGVILQVSLKRC
jgi:hypothetical protein